MANDLTGPQGDMSSPLPGGSGPGLAGPTSPSSSPSPLDPLHQAHDEAKAKFDKVSSANKILSATRAELDKLTAMGDSITSDDVLEGMAKLVSQGADPRNFVSLMAGNPAQGTQPMPESGQALAGWVQQQDQKIRQLEQQTGQVQGQVQHQLGVSALHVLAAHHIQDKMSQAATQGAPPQPNPLLA